MKRQEVLSLINVKNVSFVHVIIVNEFSVSITQYESKNKRLLLYFMSEYNVVRKCYNAILSAQ